MKSAAYLPTPEDTFQYLTKSLKGIPLIPDFSQLSFRSGDKPQNLKSMVKTIVLRDGDSVESRLFSRDNDLNVTLVGREKNEYLLVQSTLPKRLKEKGYTLTGGNIHYDHPAVALDISFEVQKGPMKREGFYTFSKQSSDGKNNFESFKEFEALKEWHLKISYVLKYRNSLNKAPDGNNGHVSVFVRLKSKK